MPYTQRMNASCQKNTDDIIRALVDHAPIKVWSYLATIFGDLAGGPQDEISGAMLRTLTERAGIKPEAMRVALHRLRKDDWIVARKAGRNSLYRLSARGLAETQRASDRIYARRIDRPDMWHLLIADPVSNAFPASVDALMKNGDYLSISPAIVLGTGPCPPVSDDVLTLDFTRLTAPPWLLRNAIAEEGVAMYRRTADLLTQTADRLDPVDAAAPVDRATIRLLALHQWRRIALRHSPLIEMLHSDDWAGTTCRTAIARILDQLPRPAGEF